jgi:hypothetical protein
MGKDKLIRKNVGGCYGFKQRYGREIAIILAKSHNYSGIVTNAREPEHALSVTKEINELGCCKSIAIEADISLERDCVKLIEETVEA